MLLNLITSRRRFDLNAHAYGTLTGPPREDIDQLKRIMEVVGTPTPELLKKICSEHVSEGRKVLTRIRLPRCFRGNWRPLN